MNNCEIIIKQENPADFGEVYKLVKLSFATTTISDGTEADYLNEIRKKDSFIPQLSLVAKLNNGKIIGQIVLYKTEITTKNKKYCELLLSPISVHPSYFCQGIATALIQKAFILAKNMGYNAVFLCGDPNFYQKFNFVPTYKYKIYHVNDKKNAPWCMVRELTPDYLQKINGIIDIL